MRTVAIAMSALLLALVAGGVSQAQSEDSRYYRTSFRGKLTEPGSKKPLSGAEVTLTSVQTGDSFTSQTEPDGSFSFEGLSYGSYTIEIMTADGERIQGVNAIPISDDEAVEIILRISDRLESETMLDSRPDRFVSAVQRERPKWKRFWKEFAIFFGIAAAGGAAVL